MFLRISQGTSAEIIAPVLDALWRMHDELRVGHVRDLPGVDIPPSGLTVLWGYGPKAFRIPGAKRALPSDLGDHNQFYNPSAAIPSPILPGSLINFDTGLARNPATEELAIQAIGDTPLAVSRMVVESWKLLNEYRDAASQRLLLEMTASFTGFNREDGRSWVGFHDGVSNLKSGDQRFQSIAVKNQGLPDNQWTKGGTYLCFLRLSVDLAVWQQLSQAEQEKIVGRSKITGCPLASVDAAGRPLPAGGCPVAGTSRPTDPQNSKFREPSGLVTGALKFSHVQRANHDHDTRFSTPDSNRIFRQGYEFVDPPYPGRDLSVGLNFVSFQDTPSRVIATLTQANWLGDTNFGGDLATQSTTVGRLLKAQAAGIFFCPEAPASGDFPGSSIFRTSPLLA
jgi:Dyp-type peroxidase family